MKTGSHLLISALIFTMTLSACSGARGLNRQILQESFHDHPEVATDRDIAGAMAVHATLPMPYRLAVYFKQKDFPSRPALHRVDWVTADATVSSRRSDRYRRKAFFNERSSSPIQPCKAQPFVTFGWPLPATTPTRFSSSKGLRHLNGTTTATPGGMPPGSAPILPTALRAMPCSWWKVRCGMCGPGISTARKPRKVRRHSSARRHHSTTEPPLPRRKMSRCRGSAESLPICCVR